MKTRVFLLLFLCLVLSTSPSVRAADNLWTTMEPMPTAKMVSGVGVVDRKIYVFSGTASEEYDPTTDTWSSKNPMPTNIHDFGAAVVDNKIYIIGGGSETGTHRWNTVYDPLTDTWETKSPFQTLRQLPIVNAVNEKIYVMAGYLRDNPLLIPHRINVTEIYDPATDTWTTGASVPNFEGEGSSKILVSAVLDDKIYVIDNVTTRIYDAKTDTWSFGTPLPGTSIRGGAAAATSGDFAPKRIYVVGGVTNSDYDFNNITYIYDPENDTWTTGAPMLTLRYALGIAVVDDKLYAFGGYDNEKYYNINEMYTPLGYIPEFPSWVFLPFFLMVTFVVVVVRKKLFCS